MTAEQFNILVEQNNSVITCLVQLHNDLCFIVGGAAVILLSLLIYNTIKMCYSRF